ncbi:MAG TPA: hypothetical protein VIV40_08085 [Kofleriaceae bacterium]
MSLRRFLSVSSVVVVATGAALAQPKKDAKKTPAPATGSAAPAGSAAAPAGSAEGSAVQPIEDAPPSDMEGRDENPDAPRGTEVKAEVVTGPVEQKPTGYPIELALRPITLPANMAEVSIGPHLVAKPYAGSDALRARYGITPKIQLGLTYMMYGVYRDDVVDMGASKKYAFHPGKAGGLDVTVLVTNWVGVRVGLPIYLDPFAMGITLGAPLKFKLTDKVALGGMDDLLTIALPVGAEFAPSYYHEYINAERANRDLNGTAQSRGLLKFSAYGIYQHKPNLAIIGRAALEFEDFSSRLTAAGGKATTSIHGGVMFTPKKFLDVGATIGFDDLATLPETFALSGFLAVRI